VGSHDTASAVAGIPYTGEHHAFISSGTWSLMGMELEEPMINEASLSVNFTNEGGATGTIRFLKNICGLWVLQQLRKEWKTEFPEIIRQAQENMDCPFMIDPDEDRFTAPYSMEKEVKAYCIEHGQGEPKTWGEMAAAVYKGLTYKYQLCIETMEKITGQKIEAIHMVGGGIQDQLLCRLTAERTGKPVITGPIEAAALGNILMQQMALGELDDLDEGRKKIGASFPLSRYEA
ncbi:MAG: rhamnulokinase, partial [Firmicutes bacterium]|nr:rhamnulokinase [Bacillota bacterium]